MSSHVDVRPYREADRAGLERCFAALQDHLVAIDPLRRLVRPEDYGPRYADELLDWVARGGGVVLVADADGEIAGCCIGVLQPQDSIEKLENVEALPGRITDMFVMPDHRRIGVGKRLIGAVENALRGLGCDVCRIGVFAPNEGARRFYAACGYGERDIFVHKEL